jgi:hypothetical protein
VVPALLFAAPETVPATPLFLALPLVLTMAVRERRDLDRGSALRLTIGRVPGRSPARRSSRACPSMPSPRSSASPCSSRSA